MYISCFWRTGSQTGGPQRCRKLYQVCFKSKEKKLNKKVYASVTAAVSFACSVMIQYMKALRAFVNTLSKTSNFKHLHPLKVKKLFELHFNCLWFRTKRWEGMQWTGFFTILIVKFKKSVQGYGSTSCKSVPFKKNVGRAFTQWDEVWHPNGFQRPINRAIKTT